MPFATPASGWNTENFTARAIKALRLASEEAQRLQHTDIGTQHLLLGLVREGEGVAARVLKHHEIDLTSVREVVASTHAERRPAEGSARPTRGQRATEAAEAAVERARHEAQDLGHNFVGTEHVLLALLHADDGVAADVLRTLAADPRAIAADVVQVVSIGALTSALQSLRSPKDHVVTCRVEDHALDAIDALVEAGIRSTRSDAAAWLIRSGIEANREFFEQVYATVGEIRRLREQARALARQAPPE